MDLKKFLDAVNSAQARVQSKAAQIDALITEGKTDEAIGLRPELDKAKGEYDNANQLYLSMLNATSQGGNEPVQQVMSHGSVQVIKDVADQPFESQGKFFQAVKNAALYPAHEDPRLRPLKVKDATGMSEGVPADGGYLLNPQVSNGLLERMYASGSILQRVASDPIGANSNSMLYNGVDETSRVGGSRHGGIVGYWLAEGGSITASKPKFNQIELKLKKVAAMCYATDEQLEDTTNLESWLTRTVPDELRFMAEDAIFEGDGVGKPLGILNSPCLISVPRQALAAIAYLDVVNMWARRWSGVRDYVWLINQDVTPQLDQLYLTSTLAVPPNFLAYGQDGIMRMKGVPVIEVEYAATMGTVGDIMLASLSQYQTITKGNVKTASSIHVAFSTAETAFRFIMRIDGQPSWGSAVTPLHGTNTQSPFVALATATA